jgi:hypothetical protein
MANGRCVIHGGKSPKGKDHPSFKTGLHSKYCTHKLEDFLEANPAVAQDLEQADLQGVDDEIRLFTAMLMMHMEKRPKRGKGRSDWIAGTVDILAELIKAKERRHKMQKELRTITLEELQHLIRRYTILVYTAVENEVQDEKLKEKLLARLQTIPEQVATSVGT